MTNLSSLSKAKIAAFISITFSIVSLVITVTSGGFGWDELPSFLSLLSCALIIYYLIKLHRSVENASEGLVRLTKGDFSARILNITEKGDMGELYHHINDMTDVMDAFVREATACMQAVNENKYFRRILPNGMQGSLLRGSDVINKALINVGKKMNDFRSVAKDVDVALNSVASEITTTIATLNNSTEEMERAAFEANEKSQRAIRGAEETSLSVDTISSASEEMSASIGEISHQVNKSSQISSQAVNTAEIAQSRMTELAETVDKINNVVLLIEDIANQTNLLALNATIEAARAGEAGKGFAVVASEVKTLASQTTDATEGIRQQIEAIQTATKLSTQSFEEIAAIVNEMNTYTANISAAIEEQSAASREIANSSARAAEGTMSVSGNIGELGQDIAQVSSATQGVVDISRSLSNNTAVSVKDLVRKMDEFMVELNKVV